MDTRAIVYDRFRHEYALYLNGQYVGGASSYSEGDAVLDRVIADRRAASQRVLSLVQLENQPNVVYCASV